MVGLMAERRQQIKMQFSYLNFKHPNNLRTSDELSRLWQSTGGNDG